MTKASLIEKVEEKEKKTRKIVKGWKEKEEEINDVYRERTGRRNKVTNEGYTLKRYYKVQKREIEKRNNTIPRERERSK